MFKLAHLAGVAGLAAALVAPGVASATTVFAQSVTEAIIDPIAPGDRGPEGDTDPSISAVGAPDGDFYSPGIGGVLVLDFGTTFANAALIESFEITFTCSDMSSGDGCDNFPEAAELYVGSGWVTGGADAAGALALNTGFTLVTEIFNDQAQNGFVTALVSGAFSQIAFVDTSAQFLGSNPQIATVNAGFDVDAVGVAPIPLPAGFAMLLSALGMVGWMRRRAA